MPGTHTESDPHLRISRAINWPVRGGGGHFVTIQPRPGDVGKVIIDGSSYTSYCAGLVLLGSGAESEDQRTETSKSSR